MADPLEDLDFYDCVLEGATLVGQTVQAALTTPNGQSVTIQFCGVEFLEIRRIGEIMDWAEGLPTAPRQIAERQRQRLGDGANASIRGLQFLDADNSPFFTVLFESCKQIVNQ